jgi:hypothetical protein
VSEGMVKICRVSGERWEETVVDARQEAHLPEEGSERHDVGIDIHLVQFCFTEDRRPERCSYVS